MIEVEGREVGQGGRGGRGGRAAKEGRVERGGRGGRANDDNTLHYIREYSRDKKLVQPNRCGCGTFSRMYKYVFVQRFRQQRRTSMSIQGDAVVHMPPWYGDTETPQTASGRAAKASESEKRACCRFMSSENEL